MKFVNHKWYWVNNKSCAAQITVMFSVFHKLPVYLSSYFPVYQLSKTLLFSYSSSVSDIAWQTD